MIWILFTCGLSLVMLSAFYLFLAWQSPQWPSTQGTVLFSEVLERKNTTTGQLTYRPVLVYQFFANGKERESNFICFMVATNGKEWSEHILVGREAGKSIEVFYHPRFPRFSVVETGVRQWGAWVSMIGFGFFVALASGIALFAENPHLLLDTLFGWIHALIKIA